MNLFCYKEKDFIHMNRWERFDEMLLLNKKDFYSNLNMEDITDVGITCRCV